MKFTIRPNKKNQQWIKKGLKKGALKVEIAALDQWLSEGGSVADETQPATKQRMIIYYPSKHIPPHHSNRRFI